jgi:hypothetical protein
LVQFLPLKRKFGVLGSKIIVPIFESCRSFFFDLICKLLKSFKLNKFLHLKPCKIWKPLFERVWNVGILRALQ